MSDERKYYCYCEDNCRFETMTKEQILAAIAQAIETGSVGNCDTGFVTKIKESNGGSYVTFWVGTQAQYNAIEKPDMNCMYIITDDTSSDDLLKTIEQMATESKSAAESAAAAATSAAAAATSAQKVDISDKVSITLDVEHTTANITDGYIYPPKYIYFPCIGIVFFSLNMSFTGSWSAGNKIQLAHSGGYAPASNTAVACDSPYYSVLYKGHGIEFTAAVQSPADFVGGMVTVTGWYFCDGEESE